MCLRCADPLSEGFGVLAEAQSSLDDFLGAVYALIRAKYKKFQDRPGRQIDINFVAQRAKRIAAGNIKTDGLWIEGLYFFNNALFRTAAVYHRMLQVVAGQDGNVPALQLAALARYPLGGNVCFGSKPPVQYFW